MSELTAMSAAEMAAAVRERRVSPRELVRAHLERIEWLNPDLNAYIWVNPHAEAEARAAEERVTRGQSRGSLEGVPISIKNCIEVPGAPFECGSRLREGVRGKVDAPLVQRLKDAGAIVLGATNSPEMLMSWETDNDLYGRTNNPWDLARTPGGSSGGESAAIAAQISAGGVGSDGGGSIRVPAHFSGICGLKPTPGRIPLSGHYPPGLGSFAHTGVVGPMARTVADLQMMFQAMAGPDRGDVATAPVPFSPMKSEQSRKLRVGVFEDDGLTPVTAETRTAIRLAADALRQAGYEVVDFRPAGLDKVRKLWWTFFVVGAGTVLEPMYAGRPQDVSFILREFLDIYRSQPKPDPLTFFNAWMERDLARMHFLEQMEQFPILLCPACAVPAFEHRQRRWEIEGREVGYINLETDIVSYTQWFNLLGHPAVVAPVTQSAEGLPIGVQVVGRPWEEDAALAVAAEIDRAFGYRPPPMKWAREQSVVARGG